MSVTGVAYRNTAFSYPQQSQTPAGNGGGAKIDPSTIDPRNASFEEIQAYNAYLVEKGYLKIEDIAAFDNPREDDDKKKADYYSALRDWADIQYHIGNMTGYHKAARVREAWTNDVEEKDGTATYIDGKRIWNMEANIHMTSGILGFGSLDDGARFLAKYADDSTADNPIVQVEVTDKEGKTKTVRVKINEVEPGNATQLEMFAFLNHLDAQGKTGNNKQMQSYQDLIYRAQNSVNGDLSSKNAQDFMAWKQDWRAMSLLMTGYEKSALQNLADNLVTNDGVPYSYLAKDGIIDYKGVIFVCDKERKSLCLGDMSDPKKCLTIPLSGGGSLVVNRDNLGDLAAAIGMFSPEDVNRILRAIAEDAKVQQMKQQIDDETSGLDIAENTGEAGTEQGAEGLEVGTESAETAAKSAGITYADTLATGAHKPEKENQ